MLRLRKLHGVTKGHAYCGAPSPPLYGCRLFICLLLALPPGCRFDRELVFPLPNLTARADILRIHTGKWAELPTPELLQELASLCVGYCGADLKVGHGGTGTAGTVRLVLCSDIGTPWCWHPSLVVWQLLLQLSVCCTACCTTVPMPLNPADSSPSHPCRCRCRRRCARRRPWPPCAATTHRSTMRMTSC